MDRRSSPSECRREHDAEAKAKAEVVAAGYITRLVHQSRHLPELHLRQSTDSTSSTVNLIPLPLAHSTILPRNGRHQPEVLTSQTLHPCYTEAQIQSHTKGTHTSLPHLAQPIPTSSHEATLYAIQSALHGRDLSITSSETQPITATAKL